MSGLTAEELAHQAGTSPEQLERFVELGILEKPFDERDIHRVRFAERSTAQASRSKTWPAARRSTSPSRMADYARPRETLVSGDVVTLADDAAEFEPIGDIGLRGVVDAVALFRALIRDTST